MITLPILTALLLARAPAPAQDALPEVRAELVHIDIVVNDAGGQPVLSLAREDFEVLEDGKPKQALGRLVSELLSPDDEAALVTTASGPVRPPPASAAGRGPRAKVSLARPDRICACSTTSRRPNPSRSRCRPGTARPCPRPTR